MLHGLQDMIQTVSLHGHTVGNVHEAAIIADQNTSLFSRRPGLAGAPSVRPALGSKGRPCLPPLEGLWVLQVLTGIEVTAPEMGLRPHLPSVEPKHKALAHPVTAELRAAGPSTKPTPSTARSSNG